MAQHSKDVVSYHHISLRCTLMVFWLIWVTLVFVVTGDVPLLVVLVMRAMLAPCTSAIRIMLWICGLFAVLEFNANKTQLIYFYAPSVLLITPSIYLNDVKLSYSNEVVHLGHILMSTSVNIWTEIRTHCWCTFHFVDPQVNWYLLKPAVSSSISFLSVKLFSLISDKIHLYWVG